MNGIERWVNEQVGILELEGKVVEFDPSFSYSVERAVYRLTAESGLRGQIRAYYKFLLN
jgi:hypothetical protein